MTATNIEGWVRVNSNHTIDTKKIKLKFHLHSVCFVGDWHTMTECSFSSAVYQMPPWFYKLCSSEGKQENIVRKISNSPNIISRIRMKEVNVFDGSLSSFAWSHTSTTPRSHNEPF